MNITLKKELYNINNYPQQGRHILAQTTDNLIVVYQAFSMTTAKYAVTHQKLGGTAYSFNRMSWIKPNFLWMMYRSGWAQKDNQQRILAFWIKKNFFDELLSQSVVSSFDASFYEDQNSWREAIANSHVRLQWDPDHDPYGAPLTRRALQLGLRGPVLQTFACESIEYVEDITPFVHEQFVNIQEETLDTLIVPHERVYTTGDSEISKRIGLSKLID